MFLSKTKAATMGGALSCVVFAGSGFLEQTGHAQTIKADSVAPKFVHAAVDAARPPGSAFVHLTPVPEAGAISKAVEKEGISVSIGTGSRQVNADEQPSLKVRFENISRDYALLYDANSYGKWQFVFTKVDAADGEPKTWRLKFDPSPYLESTPSFKPLKRREACEVEIDLETDPQFTFTYVGEAERNKSSSRVRYLKPGKYEVKATVSLESQGSSWAGPVTTEPVRFTVSDRFSRADPSKKELAAYDKALEPVITLTNEVGGLWMNGLYHGIDLAKDADPEDVIAAVVNMNRSNLGTKAYRVLRIKPLDGEDGKRFVALISAGKKTKTFLCLPLSDKQWWSRVYDAAID